MRTIAVAVPVPGLGALTYTVPDEMPLPSVGARVLVPLGKRTVTGIVLASGEPSTAGSAPSADEATPERRIPDSRSPIPDPRSPVPL